VDIFVVFPKLNDFDEFKAKLPPTLPKDKVFKYIVYAYDQKSPFYTQIEDLVERKKAAVREAGFEPTHKSGFNENVKQMLNCEFKEINLMIIRYCRLQGRDFTNLIASQEAFYQSNVQLISNIKDVGDDANKVAQDKSKLDELLTKHAERLNEKARKFLSQETAQGLHDDLWSMAEEEAMNIKITPEDFADEEI
jgi:hypothetical protein